MSSIEKWLGRITRAEFGFGGYDDAMIGLTIAMEGDYAISDFQGFWAHRSSSAQWSLEDQRMRLGDAVVFLADTLRAAHKTHVGQLVGVPVEVTCVGNKLECWRVLSEVLAGSPD